MARINGYLQQFGCDLDVPHPLTRDKGITSLRKWGEVDTYTCNHCQVVTFVPPKERPENMGGLCKICMSLICVNCLDKGCTPWEEELNKQAAKYEALRSYGF